MKYAWRLAVVCCVLASAVSTGTTAAADEPKLELRPGDHVSIIGNTLADRMQHHGWLETLIHAQFPKHELTFRNLGFPGDKLKSRQRSQSFGSADQWLAKAESDVVFCFFGYNEAFDGEAGLPQFRQDLAETIDGMRNQKYNGNSPPRLVFFSPIAHENLYSPHLPDGSKNNANLDLYTAAMRDVCGEKNVAFVDLFHPTQELYAQADKPLTMNGIHLLEHGDLQVARVILADLFGAAQSAQPAPSELQRLHAAVLEKNLFWFSRYRVVDGYNVYGGRSTLNWFGQSNRDVMQREMDIFDVMTANRDRRVWAVAKGGDLELKDDNIPPELVVKSNKQGDLEDGSFSYLGGEEAISKMKLAPGMQVNLFASEEMFPEIVNPVQMAVDTDGRLFASVWPSYPHWNPTQPRLDRIVCLPDEDRDGVADKCVIFADKLNSVTGFEFWGGGMLVAAPPEIWFLKDTDGDDQADVKIRMLQGVSSADSHHSANAVVVGPDGWMYWSRGIFNVASMETPTKLYRSTQSGVHRFNPRTFEMEFHFPIGPNPHGDVFDQWGYQFANDGTSGTGSYVNIGKGVGNKQWFKKRVRPVAATGILSSSHFPEHNNGNFLICNTIGFLGVLQHKVKYNGADITAEEIEPILVSSDPNFRPTDVEIGSDGALYVSDWSNALIGHMQHNIRDPNRDHAHGRIYRVTYKGRPLLDPVKLKGKPIPTVLKAFHAAENSVRYRARLELSGRETADVVSAVEAFTASLDPAQPQDAQAMLECLWVMEEHRVPRLDLIQRVFTAGEPRVRAAAIRTLGHWSQRLEGWEPLLIQAARDESALVRAEAVKSAANFEGLVASEIIFEVATRTTDPEINSVLNYAKSRINVDKFVQDAVKSNRKLSPAARTYALRSANAADLLKYERSAEIYQAILDRPDVALEHLNVALEGLAKLRNLTKARLLLDIVESRDRNDHSQGVDNLAQLVTSQPQPDLASVQSRLKKLAERAQTASGRQVGYAAWLSSGADPENVVAHAADSKQRLRDFLESISRIDQSDIRARLYPSVRGLMFELPANLQSEPSAAGLNSAGIRVDYFEPNPKNVARETLDALEPKASGVVERIEMNVPQLGRRDAFALRFTGAVRIDRAGTYTFYTRSDDGSRLYIGDQLVVNNDGLHGLSEKSGKIRLSAGLHPLLVTYFDNGGGDGLSVSWSSRGLRKQPIPASHLSVSGQTTLHDLAIGKLPLIPGHDQQKYQDLTSLIASGKYVASAVMSLKQIPDSAYQGPETKAAVERLLQHVESLAVSDRTSESARDAIALTRTLAKRLPAAVAEPLEYKLSSLEVSTISLGTVPHRMIYNKERIAVATGRAVEFRFTNTDNMPHNFVIVEPGALEEVGLLAEATARDKDALQRHYVPKSNRILLSGRLLQPQQSESLIYVAPETPGIYPYVCTYPGHWRRMYGALYVVEDLEAYQADPAQYLAAHPLELKDELLKYNERNTEWTFASLVDVVDPLPHGRSFDVGKNIFKIANCVGCHRINNEGREFGPDLTKLDEKKHTVHHLLESLIDPSKKIEEKYQSYTFVLDSGKTVVGMIVKETPDQITVLNDPLGVQPPVVIKRSEIDEQVKSPVSIMPKGMANKLSREEIIDLIAYVYARGNPKHMIYAEGHDHDHGN